MRTKTTFTVTTAADVVDAGDGKLSLREAVAQANATTAADRVVFASGLEGTSMTLAHGELSVTHNLTVDCDANNDSVRVTIDGNGIGRIFNIAGSNTGVTLRDLALTGGYADDNHGTVYEGGAIFLGGGSLEVSAVDLLAGQRRGPNRRITPAVGGQLARHRLGRDRPAAVDLTLRQ